MTLVALSSRIHDFKKKYVPRYRRERNRTVLFLLLLLFGAALVALAVWLFSPIEEPPPRSPYHPAEPTHYDELFGPPLVGSAPPERATEPDGGSPAQPP
jgi:hypothetical protein